MSRYGKDMAQAARSGDVRPDISTVSARFCRLVPCVSSKKPYILPYPIEIHGVYDLDCYCHGGKDTVELQLSACLTSRIMIMQTFNQPANQQSQYTKASQFHEYYQLRRYPSNSNLSPQQAPIRTPRSHNSLLQPPSEIVTKYRHF